MEEIKREKYISCKWLESGVCFDNGFYGSNVKLCCYMSAPGGGNSMIYEGYNGEKINWDEFFRIKNKYREIQKKGDTVEGCRGCVFLEENDWLQTDYIDSIIFDHFTKCNCNCKYCYTEEDKKRYNSLKTYNIFPIIEDMYKRNILKVGGSIGFGGGEPTILPEFDKLLNFLIKKGFRNIRVPSSGIKYSRVIEKGIKTGQVTVVVSIDSSSSETYKKIKQINAYKVVSKNLIKYAKAQKQSYNVISKYIIIPNINDTKTEIDGWLSFSKENNIGIIVIDIENSWLNRYRKDKPDENVLDLIRYVKEKSQEMGFYRLEICDRARYLINT